VQRSPLRAAAKGLVVGAVGTAAMTAHQTAVMRARGAESSDVRAQVGKRVVYGIVQSTLKAAAARQGVLFGTVVWGASLVGLPVMKPCLGVPAERSWHDVSYHLVYGVTVAGAYGIIDR
jgi:hypothetical protein